MVSKIIKTSPVSWALMACLRSADTLRDIYYCGLEPPPSPGLSPDGGEGFKFESSVTLGTVPVLPKLPIVISQLGHPWIDETLLLLSKHECVFADISLVSSRPWQLYNALLDAFSMDVMDKLLFGSGFPLETPARAIESLYTVNAFSHGTQMPSVARASIRSIVERDSLACLCIDSEITTGSHRSELDEEEVMTLDDYSPVERRQEDSSDGNSEESAEGV